MASQIANGPTLTARHVPHYMRQGLTFPYVGGLKLLMIALEKSGFSGVDALHRSPPASTEQLLHPERYPADQPIAVDFTLSKPLSKATRSPCATASARWGCGSWSHRRANVKRRPKSSQTAGEAIDMPS